MRSTFLTLLISAIASAPALAFLPSPSLSLSCLRGQPEKPVAKTIRFSSPEEAQERAEATNKIKNLVTKNQVMLFMKGNKLFPQCGFSNTAVSIFRALETDFETFDVLSDMVVRDEIKKFSNWPTIPQCYINGEFVGGSDILLELYESGELEEMLAKTKKQA